MLCHLDHRCFSTRAPSLVLLRYPPSETVPWGSPLLRLGITEAPVIPLPQWLWISSETSQPVLLRLRTPVSGPPFSTWGTIRRLQDRPLPLGASIPVPALGLRPEHPRGRALNALGPR